MSTQDRQIIPDREWEKLKPEMEDLYVNQNVGVPEIMKLMKNKHGFEATKSMYETRLRKKWKLRKNIIPEQWGTIYHILQARQRVGKASHVIVHGQHKGSAEVHRQTRRHRRKGDTSHHELPDSIVIRTRPPTPSGIQPSQASPAHVAQFHGSTSRISSPRSGVNVRNIDHTDELSDNQSLAIHSQQCPPIRTNTANHDQDFELFVKVNSQLEIDTLLDNIRRRISSLLRSSVPMIQLSISLSAVLIAPLRSLCPPSAQEYLHAQGFDVKLIYSLFSYIINDMQSLRNTRKPDHQFESVIQEGIRNFVSLPPEVLAYCLDAIPTSEYLQAVEYGLFGAAIELNVPQVVGMLLQRGLDPNNVVYYVDGYQVRPLERACELHSVDMIMVLLQHGANPDIYEQNLLLLRWLYYEWENRTLSTQRHTKIAMLLLEKMQTTSSFVFEIGKCSPAVCRTICLLFPGPHYDIYIKNGILAHMLQFKHQDLDTAMESILKRDWSEDIRQSESWGEIMTCALSNAARHENMDDTINVLLEAGARPDSNCLINAVVSRNLELVELCLRHGVDANALEKIRFPGNTDICQKRTHLEHGLGTYDEKKTALSEAIRCQFDAVTNLFIMHGFIHRIEEACGAIPCQFDDVNDFFIKHGSVHRVGDASDGFKVAFQAACKAGNEPLVDVLLPILNNLALKHILEYELSSIIAIAVRFGQESIVRKLIDAGLSPDDKAVKNAVDQGYVELAKLLIAYVPGRWEERWMYDSVRNVIRMRDSDLLAALVRANFPIHHQYELEKNYAGMRWKVDLLSLSIYEGERWAFDFLLLSGVPINVYNPSESIEGMYSMPMTALSAAVYTQDTHLIGLLLDRGADPCDSSAIYMAACGEDTQFVDLILSAFKQRYPNGKRGFGAAALQKAIRDKQWPLFELLLNYTDVDDVTYYRSFSRSMNNLDDYYNCVESPLGTAISWSHSDSLNVTQTLLRNGANPNSISFWRTFSFTALQYAIYNDSLSKVKALIEYGADTSLSPADCFGRTPLQYAVELGRREIVDYLLGEGVSVNEAPIKYCGGTCLQLAAMAGDLEMAQLLLDQTPPADVNAQGAVIQGRTAFEGATERGRLYMMAFLVQNGADLLSDRGKHQYRRALWFAKNNNQYAAYNFARRLYKAVRADWSIFDTFTTFTQKQPHMDPHLLRPDALGV